MHPPRHPPFGSLRVAIIADRKDIEPLFQSTADLLSIVYVQDFVARIKLKAISDVDALQGLFEALSLLDDQPGALLPLKQRERMGLTIVGYAKDLVDAQQYVTLDNVSGPWEVKVVVVGGRLAVVHYRDQTAGKLLRQMPMQRNIPRPTILLDNAGQLHTVEAGEPVLWKDFNRTLLDELHRSGDYAQDRFDLWLVQKTAESTDLVPLYQLKTRLLSQRRSVDDIIGPEATVFFFGDSLS